MHDTYVPLDNSAAPGIFTSLSFESDLTHRYSTSVGASKHILCNKVLLGVAIPLIIAATVFGALSVTAPLWFGWSSLTCLRNTSMYIRFYFISFHLSLFNFISFHFISFNFI